MIDGIPNRPLYFYQKDVIDIGDQFPSLWSIILHTGYVGKMGEQSTRVFPRDDG